MLAFADLIHPITPEEFFSDWYGKRPLHLAAGERRPRVLDWPGVNAMLSAKDRWTEAHLKLFLDARRIPAEDYCDRVTTLDGPRLRADPAKVQLYLSVGASLVANLVDNQTPTLRAVADYAREYPDQVLAISGHTDASPIHTKEFPSNQELSEARAEAVKAYLVTDEGKIGRAHV